MHGDTDSITSDSKLLVNEQLITIEDLYKLFKGKQKETITGKEIKFNEDEKYVIDSLNGKCNIKNIIRHKVNKGKWEIKIPNKNSLYITEDHSVMVYRDGEVLEVKPNEILSTDSLIVKD